MSKVRHSEKPNVIGTDFLGAKKKAYEKKVNAEKKLKDKEKSKKEQINDFYKQTPNDGNLPPNDRLLSEDKQDTEVKETNDTIPNENKGDDDGSTRLQDNDKTISRDIPTRNKSRSTYSSRERESRISDQPRDRTYKKGNFKRIREKLFPYREEAKRRSLFRYYASKINGITEEEVERYLDSIFPDSKIKDILFHGTSVVFDKFDKSFLDRQRSSKDTSSEVLDSSLAFFATDDIVNASYYSIRSKMFYLKRLRDTFEELKENPNKDPKDFFERLDNLRYFKDSFKDIADIRELTDENINRLENFFEDAKEYFEEMSIDEQEHTNTLYYTEAMLKEIEKLETAFYNGTLLDHNIFGDPNKESIQLTIGRDNVGIYKDPDAIAIEVGKYFYYVKNNEKEPYDLNNAFNAILDLLERTDNRYGRYGFNTEVMPVVINSKDISSKDYLDLSDNVLDEHTKQANEAFNSGKDTIEYLNVKDPVRATNYGIFNPDNIHILGSDEDIKALKEFLGKESIDNKSTTLPTKDFGINYPKFYHKGKEAVKHLLKVKQGQVQGAFYRKELGDIDLVWGEIIDKEKQKGYGLVHILDKHPNDFKKFGNGLDGVINALDEIISKGDIKENAGVETLVLEKDGKTYRVGLTKGWNKVGDNKWIITAYEMLPLDSDFRPSNQLTQQDGTDLLVEGSKSIIPKRSDEIQWSRYPNGKPSFEVSTKGTDLGKRFSAFWARIHDSFLPNKFPLNLNTKGKFKLLIGKTSPNIETIYQEYMKMSAKGRMPHKDSILNVNGWSNETKEMLLNHPEVDLRAKKLIQKLVNTKEFFTREELEDLSYYIGYLPLWRIWAENNLDKMFELYEEVKDGKVLTDMFANTRVSQARALSDILNSKWFNNELNKKNGNSQDFTDKSLTSETDNYNDESILQNKTKEATKSNTNEVFKYTDNTLDYEYDPTTQEIHHISRTTGKRTLKTEKAIIAKVLRAYALKNRLEQKKFNYQQYSKVGNYVVNVSSKVPSIVTNPDIVYLFKNKDSDFIEPNISSSLYEKGHTSELFTGYDVKEYFNLIEKHLVDLERAGKKPIPDKDVERLYKNVFNADEVFKSFKDGVLKDFKGNSLAEKFLNYRLALINFKTTKINTLIKNHFPDNDDLKFIKDLYDSIPSDSSYSIKEVIFNTAMLNGLLDSDGDMKTNISDANIKKFIQEYEHIIGYIKDVENVSNSPDLETEMNNLEKLSSRNLAEEFDNDPTIAKDIFNQMQVLDEVDGKEVSSSHQEYLRSLLDTFVDKSKKFIPEIRVILTDVANKRNGGVMNYTNNTLNLYHGNQVSPI